MNMKKNALAMAVCATLGIHSEAGATTYAARLVSVTSYSNNGSSAANLSSSTATWQYDDATGLLSQTGGTFDSRYTIVPVTTLFRHSMIGLVVGAGASADATSFVCTEGNFGAVVGASICGNYQFRGNGLDDSTVTWGPGIAFDRTIGGDDMALGPQQSLLLYDGISQQSLAAGTLVLCNAVCVSGPLIDCNENPDVVNVGYDMTLALRGAGADSASTRLNTDTAPIDVLANDLGLQDPVTVSITVPPDAGGSVRVTDGGSDCAAPCTADAADIRVILTPSALPGTATYAETFGYEVSDGSGTLAATVTVSVENLVPDAIGGGLSPISTQGIAPAGLTGTFTAPGAGGSLGDPGAGARVDITAQGSRGNVSVSGNLMTYTITDAGFFSGSDEFSYEVTDSDGETSTATVTVVIPDLSPVLADAQVETLADTASQTDLLALTEPGNGSPAQHAFGVVAGAAHGECAISGTTLAYTPESGYTGADSCQVQVQDGDGSSAQALVSFIVSDSGTGLRESGGGSASDLLLLAVFGAGLLGQRRIPRSAQGVTRDGANDIPV